jgi:hypothetical protein
MAKEHVGIFLPVSEVFSDTESKFDTFISLFKKFSRTDALFWVSRTLTVELSTNDEQVPAWH